MRFEIELLVQKVGMMGKPEGSPSVQDIANMVSEKCYYPAFAEGALERVAERLVHAQELIAALIEVLAAKGVLEDEELGELLEGYDARVVRITRKAVE